MAKNTKKEVDLSFLTAFDLPMNKEGIKQSFANHVEFTLGKDQYSATPNDYFKSMAYSVRDRMFDRWNKTQQAYYNSNEKRIYYLSLEFLIGRILEDSIMNLDVREESRLALEDLGMDMDDLISKEWDAGLGNGGLGRLAACFLDSMATLGLPAVGYGIRYEFGIFKQILVDGNQVENPDNWLRYGNPWEIERPERLYPVRFYGHVANYQDETGQNRVSWNDTENVMAMAYDIPVPGYRNETVNTLRLWGAKSTREFNFTNFNEGDYIQAVHDKNTSENISKVLYPNDSPIQGKELRLKQEYFFVTATLQDALRRALKHDHKIGDLPRYAVFQLNDTHPAIAIPELMRILMDESRVGWEEAWEITTRCFAYTNHTVLPEALEVWPVALMERLLPRHMQIIYEINRRFLDGVRSRFRGDDGKIQRMSLIQEGAERQVRMAHLAIVGSFSVNGVSKLHSDLLRDRVFPDFSAYFPGKFNNKTNGITPRRWLKKCNRGLARLITSKIGEGWVTDLAQLKKLEQWADDSAFQDQWRQVKRHNKETLAQQLACYGVIADPDSLFDVQVKRIHEYKRQLLNILHVMHLYRTYKTNPPKNIVPRTFVFAGKAAPGYLTAKRIIRLINAVAWTVNRDRETGPYLKVVFMPDYNVSLAEIIMPAADISEQISLAGTEASGTGNMKLSLNGALTVGTLDGANVEIMEAVGADNIFIFGLKEGDVDQVKAAGYNPRHYYNTDPNLKGVLDMLEAGDFYQEDRALFRPLVDYLLNQDPFLVLADFNRYVACQERVSALYRDPAAWTKTSIINVANMGRFSSDSTIAEYARDIWKVPPAPHRMVDAGAKASRAKK
ncbi:MAG: glycogen/starch/alpha-glucan phosphorylase [Deltaproteobacteria bacterium]|nr:glycogen/starch/alpha-glucan phosphorylase [Deltaproteobacteria bacterium]